MVSRKEDIYETIFEGGRDHKIKPEDYPEIVEKMLDIDLTELQKEMIVRSASLPPGAKLCWFPGGRIRLVVPREEKK